MFQLKNIKFKNVIDIDYLEIKDANLTIISGKSGSGKTTLLKMLNLLISPDSGEIYYNGKNLKNVDPIVHRREVLMLPQNPTIFSGSILENIKLGFKFSNKKLPSENIIIKMLKSLNLNKDLNTDARNLSGGEKQKLAAARILLLNPKVILLDEPTSALDDENEDDLISEIVNYSSNHGIKIIMITHSTSLKEKYKDNIITLDNGRVVKWRE